MSPPEQVTWRSAVLMLAYSGQGSGWTLLPGLHVVLLCRNIFPSSKLLLLLRCLWIPQEVSATIPVLMENIHILYTVFISAAKRPPPGPRSDGTPLIAGLHCRQPKALTFDPGIIRL